MLATLTVVLQIDPVTVISTTNIRTTTSETSNVRTGALRPPLCRNDPGRTPIRVVAQGIRVYNSAYVTYFLTMEITISRIIKAHVYLFIVVPNMQVIEGLLNPVSLGRPTTLQDKTSTSVQSINVSKKLTILVPFILRSPWV